MHLANPWLLCALVGLLPMLVIYRRRPAAVRFPSIKLLSALRPSPVTRLRHLPFILRCIAVALLSLALARPQDGGTKTERQADGLDIMLVLDTSGSMKTPDYVWGNERMERIGVVKRVISNFVGERPSDRIGMVVFGTEAFTQAPLTLDHELLTRFIANIKIGMAGEATAMGDGMATAVSRLKKINSKTKIAILLTDGGNNAGRVDPLLAAEAAKALGVKIYTIGIGSVQHQSEDLDEGVLKDIAERTGAQYFRAADVETLVNVYEIIDKLEKTRLKLPVFTDYEERYAGFAALALVALLAEMALGLTRLRRIP